MRVLQTQKIEDVVADLYKDVTINVSEEMREAFKRGLETEKSELGVEVFQRLLENADIARSERIPSCQDTGIAIAWIRVGDQVQLSGDSLQSAVDRGVSRANKEAYLRSSVVSDPLRRKNTGDNTPAEIHLESIPGEQVRIALMAKGTGAENMSALIMLVPADGWEGVKKFVVKTVAEAGPNACPPVVVGVGIGGTFGLVGWLAKKALFRSLNQRNPDEFLAQRELELLEAVNKLNIGPMGFGGANTAFDVHIETHPCHIGALPVAVNLDCHAHRWKETVL